MGRSRHIADAHAATMHKVASRFLRAGRCISNKRIENARAGCADAGDRIALRAG